MNVGLLMIRVVVGLLFVGHGTQKLFGWLGGGGLEGTGGFFSSLGYPSGRRMAALAGTAETGGGALLVLGLATPLAAAAIIGVMLNAIVVVHWPRGAWVTNGGYEYPLVLAVAAFSLAWTGPGAYSLDNAIGWHPGAAAAGVLAFAAGMLAGVAVLSTRRRALEQRMEQEQPSARPSRAA